MSLLRIEGLRVTLRVAGQDRPVLRGLDLEVGEGESLAVVGESGSGKSMTARAIARMLPPSAVTSGTVRVGPRDVLRLGGSELRSYQAREVAVIHQDPRAHMNPVRTVGDFVTEGMVTSLGIKRPAAEKRAIDLLAEVGVPDGERRLRQYPHQLSGGLLQRVMIAAALAGGPRLLLADEPTTALDVSTQAEVVALLARLRLEHQLALVFITHDLELAATVCERTAVMYAGELVEVRPSGELMRQPRHPYTAGLLAARPHVDRAVPRLQVIPGTPLAAFEAPSGCAFADRCAHAQDRCTTGHPTLEVEPTGAVVRCWRSHELNLTEPPSEGRPAHV